MPQDFAASPSVRLERQELNAIARLSGVAVARLLGLFMVLPVMALWADGLDGATPLLVGIAVGGYGVTQALLQIPYGALSDRLGRRPVAAFGLCVFLLGSAWVAGAETIHGVIVGRLLQGAGAVSATLSAWLADRTRDAVRTPAMAIFGASIGASFLLALVVGPLLSAWVGVRGLFWLSAGLGAFAVVMTLTTAPGRPRAARARVAVDWTRVLRPELVALDVAILLLHAALTAFFVLAPYLLSDRLAVAATGHWQIYTVSLLAALPIAIPMIMRDGRQPGSRFLLIALALLCGGFALLAAATTLVGFGVGATLFLGGFSYLEAALPARVSRLADPEQRGASLGLFSSSQFFGAFVGGAAAGWFVDDLGPATGATVIAVVLALWLLAQVAFSRRTPAISAGN